MKFILVLRGNADHSCCALQQGFSPPLPSTPLLKISLQQSKRLANSKGQNLSDWGAASNSCTLEKIKPGKSIGSFCFIISRKIFNCSSVSQNSCGHSRKKAALGCGNQLYSTSLPELHLSLQAFYLLWQRKVHLWCLQICDGVGSPLENCSKAEESSSFSDACKAELSFMSSLHFSKNRDYCKGPQAFLQSLNPTVLLHQQNLWEGLWAAPALQTHCIK